MPKALASNEIYFSSVEAATSDKQILALIDECIVFYKERPRKTPGAIIILFESDFEISRLLRLHIEAKPLCIKNELMIGALYRDSPAPSLHSPEYFPLRTPTPTLVLRDLTSQDLIFLNPDHYDVKSKMAFLDSFINKFGSAEGRGYTGRQLAQAKALRGIYKTALLKRLGVVASALFACSALAIYLSRGV